MAQLFRLAEAVVLHSVDLLPWIGLLICALLLIVWRGKLQTQPLSRIGLYATLPVALFVGGFAAIMQNPFSVGAVIGLLSFMLYYAPLAVLTVIFLLSAGFSLKSGSSVRRAATWPWSGHLVLALIAATYVLLFVSYRLSVPESCAEMPFGC